MSRILYMYSGLTVKRLFGAPGRSLRTAGPLHVPVACQCTVGRLP
jgi:hypothetical protein